MGWTGWAWPRGLGQENVLNSDAGRLWAETFRPVARFIRSADVWSWEPVAGRVSQPGSRTSVSRAAR